MAVTGRFGQVQRFALVNDAQTGELFIHRISAIAMTTAGDVIDITDTAGNPIVKFVAGSNGESRDVYLDELYDGIVMATMASGEVEVQYGRPT